MFEERQSSELRLPGHKVPCIADPRARESSSVILPYIPAHPIKSYPVNLAFQKGKS